MTTWIVLRLHRARLLAPATVLMMLLQRTPVLRALVSADFAIAPRLGQMLRAAFPLVAGTVTLNTLTGATRFTANPVSPATATVGTSFSGVFAVTGAPSTPKSYTFSNLPPGLTVSAGSLSGTTWTVNGSTASVSGIPTTAGNYTVGVRAWANLDAKGDKSPIYNYVINVTGSAATAPSFTTNPSSQTVTAGGSASFTVAASGSPTPTLQWRKGGANLAGQTGSTLALINVGPADAGTYDCVATNTAGSTTSSAATLTVNVAPAFSTQPASQSVTEGGSVSFSVAVTGTPIPTLQWRKGGVSLSGETGTTLTLTGVSLGNAGSYTCVATNSAGSATSSTAALTVNAATAAPSFTTQPVSQSASAGSSVMFTVVATGTPAPTLQWRKNTVTLPGQTGLSLSLANVGPADAGNYDCIATNTAGSATSAAATLTIAAAVPPTIAVQPVPMRSLAGGNAFFAATATDANVTYQWLKDGNPIPGATRAALSLAGVQADDAGAYAVVVTSGSGAQSTSEAATLTIATSGSARLVNMSARAGVGTGADALIPGFVIDGDVALTVLVRGVGPQLGVYGVPGILDDPVMSLYRGSDLIATNDDWEQSPDLAAMNAATTSTGAFPLSSGGKDCAMLVTLNPGLYTVTVSGKDGLTGIALVELYVVDP